MSATYVVTNVDQHANIVSTSLNIDYLETAKVETKVNAMSTFIYF